MRALAIVAALAAPALADAPSKKVADKIIRELDHVIWDHHDTKVDPPKLLIDYTVALAPTIGDLGGEPVSPEPKPVVAIAADGKSAWVAAELSVPPQPCGDMDLPACPKHFEYSPDHHAAVLFDGTPGRAIVLHIGQTLSAKDLAKAVAANPKPAAFPRQVDEAAAVPATLFETTIGDPKAFAATISDRGDVVLYGSEQSERYVGGKAAAATLAKWNLAFTVRDGLVAGTTSSKTVAYIAANVDARPASKPKAVPTPYRVTAIYERTGTTWKVVQLHFSFSAS